MNWAIKYVANAACRYKRQEERTVNPSVNGDGRTSTVPNQFFDLMFGISDRAVVLTTALRRRGFSQWISSSTWRERPSSSAVAQAMNSHPERKPAQRGLARQLRDFRREPPWRSTTEGSSMPSRRRCTLLCLPRFMSNARGAPPGSVDPGAVRVTVQRRIEFLPDYCPRCNPLGHYADSRIRLASLTDPTTITWSGGRRVRCDYCCHACGHEWRRSDLWTAEEAGFENRRRPARPCPVQPSPR